MKTGNVFDLVNLILELIDLELAETILLTITLFLLLFLPRAFCFSVLLAATLLLSEDELLVCSIRAWVVIFSLTLFGSSNRKLYASSKASARSSSPSSSDSKGCSSDLSVGIHALDDMKFVKKVSGSLSALSTSSLVSVLGRGAGADLRMRNSSSSSSPLPSFPARVSSSSAAACISLITLFFKSSCS